MNPKIIQVLVFSYLVGLFVASFLGMATLWAGLFDPYIQIDNKETIKHFIVYSLAGASGGTLYCLRLFYSFYIRGNLQIDKWWIWYFLRPIMSAGTAAMVIILFQSGIVLLETGNSLEAKVGLGFLVGYGFGKVMDKLEGITITLFNGNSNK
jgi:hypothetical protein